MSAVTDAETVGELPPGGPASGPSPADPAAPYHRDSGLLASLVVAAAAGAALVLTARTGATALLVAVAVAQGLLAVAWIFGNHQPGRIGGLVIAALAAGAADTAVSVWPHGRLGVLVAVLGLAVPVMFVHQLSRGAARVHVVASLSGIAVLVFAETSLPAFVQLRHELDSPTQAGRVVAAAAGAIAVALVVGYLVDLVLPLPRFDPQVSRGLPAVLASAAVGAVFAYYVLRDDAGGRGFTDGRALFLGAALGALAALIAVATAFAAHALPAPATNARAGLRRTVAAVLPLCVLAPPTFLLCLAIRG